MFRDKSDSFLKCSDVFGTMRILMSIALVYDKLTAEKCVEDASEYIWLRWEARSFLIGNRKVLNWIVFRDKSDRFLKCL